MAEAARVRAMRAERNFMVGWKRVNWVFDEGS
jgi:hypothetical protein